MINDHWASGLGTLDVAAMANWSVTLLQRGRPLLRYNHLGNWPRSPPFLFIPREVRNSELIRSFQIFYILATNSNMLK